MTRFELRDGQFGLVRELVSVPERWHGFLPDDQPVPEPVERWLAALALLHGVPFGAIVPDERALPPDSICFFYVDPNWTAAACDGALSLGRVTSFDRAHDEAVAELAHARLHARRPGIRARLLGREPDGEPPAQALETGFLLRSEAVEAWPALQVKAWADAAAKQPIELLRLEHVSPSVLLCLFAGVLRCVDISEPSEGLQFGADPGEPADDPARFTRPPRDASGKLDKDHAVPVPFRGPPSDRVVDVVALARTLAGTHPALSSGEFAFQMVEAPETARFVVGTAPPADLPAPAPALRVGDAQAHGRALLDDFVQEVLARD